MCACACACACVRACVHECVRACATKRGWYITRRDLNEETPEGCCELGKVVVSSLRWAGHIQRMNDEIFTNPKAVAEEEENHN